MHKKTNEIKQIEKKKKIDVFKQIGNKTDAQLKQIEIIKRFIESALSLLSTSLHFFLLSTSPSERRTSRYLLSVSPFSPPLPPPHITPSSPCALMQEGPA